MRYRVFDKNGSVCVFEDRPAFDRSFLGIDPNHPAGGIVMCRGNYYLITSYSEFASLSKSENEFHEIENNWYAHLQVHLIDIEERNNLVRDVKIKKYLVPLA
jgi:hypothetical protein